jgi:hypothetical protein
VNHTDFLAAGAFILSNIKENEPNMGLPSKKIEKENVAGGHPIQLSRANKSEPVSFSLNHKFCLSLR